MVRVEKASTMEPKVHTTLPKVDKVETSLVEAPTVSALVVRPGSKVPNDTPSDDDRLLDELHVVEVLA
jgi:hypothetical protein